MTSLRLTAAICVVCICFLSSAHAAWIIDGSGFRKVNISALLAEAAQRMEKIQKAPTCLRGDAVLRLGTTWRERCRECNCTEQGTRCTGPTCAIPYDPVQETTCARFTPDDCCCQETGCILENGTTIPVGGDMPFDPARPCFSCKCRGGNHTSCLVQSCYPYQCVDAVPREGQCCPDCPNGRTCVLPHEVRRRLSQAEVDAAEPVREFSPVTVMAGTADEMRCTCSGNLVATCDRSANLEKPVFGQPPIKVVV